MQLPPRSWGRHLLNGADAYLPPGRPVECGGRGPQARRRRFGCLISSAPEGPELRTTKGVGRLRVGPWPSRPSSEVFDGQDARVPVRYKRLPSWPVKDLRP
ncbi:MAG: hypothetical protein Kow00109_17720 [Acidobacteriota bacterium]